MDKPVVAAGASPAGLPELVISPCVGICRLNAQQLCVGCGRTLAEIGAWLRSNNEQRRAIVLAARERLAAGVADVS